MTGLQVFIWLSLVGTTPGMGRAEKWIAGLLGILAALTGLIGVVFLIETFQLAPHKGFLKAAVILLPFVVYYLWCFPPGAFRSSHRSYFGGVGSDGNRPSGVRSGPP